MAGNIADRTIMITGAGGGFGRLVAQKASALGARIVATDIDEPGLAETAAPLDDERTLSMPVDVTALAQMRAAAAAAVERFGSIDVMVNNAGVMPLAFFADHEAAAEAWTRCIDINFKGVVNGIAAVHDQMIAQGRGHVVNISSIYGNYPVAGAGVYGATKAAVNVLSESLRQESLGRIKVTTIRPTGVPGTGLGGGIVNPEAIDGILGAERDDFMATMGEVFGEQPPHELTETDSIGYFMLAPELLADQIIYAIDQPWGVSISDVTVRASGDRYVI